MGSTDGHGLHRVPFLMCYGTVLTSNAILDWQQDNRIEWHHIAPGKPTQTAFVAGRAESNLSRTLKKDELKATRDQARIDAERSRAAPSRTPGRSSPRPNWTNSPRQRAAGYGVATAAIGGIICARLRSASRSPNAKSGSWDRKTPCCGC